MWKIALFFRADLKKNLIEATPVKKSYYLILGFQING